MFSAARPLDVRPIAAGMIPILVLAAWPLGKNLTLYFADFEVGLEGLAYIAAVVANQNAAVNIRRSCFSSLVRTSRSYRANVRLAEVFVVVRSHAGQHPPPGW
jgi:hypothetical protein